jgi:hypothetical protein
MSCNHDSLTKAENSRGKHLGETAEQMRTSLGPESGTAKETVTKEGTGPEGGRIRVSGFPYLIFKWWAVSQ